MIELITWYNFLFSSRSLYCLSKVSFIYFMEVVGKFKKFHYSFWYMDMKYTLSLIICETEVLEKKYCNIFGMWVFIREVGENELETETLIFWYIHQSQRKKNSIWMHW